MIAGVTAFGRRAALVEVSTQEEVHRLWRGVLDGPLGRTAGLEDCVPGARTVLLLFEVGRRPELPELEAALRRLDPVPAVDRLGSHAITIPVVYDGADLHTVAELTGLSADEVVARHQRAEYTVGFLGFAPGFAYLIGGDPKLRVRRLDTPRPRVPVGAVALADDMTAVYPSSSPGGWRLIGRTDAVLFDPDRRSPALWAPGDRVRFRRVDVVGSPTPLLRPSLRGGHVEVVSAGPLTTVQDGGRVGWAHLGVPRAGPVDPGAAALANRMAGNRTEDRPAVLEVTVSGPVLRFRSPTLVALAGAPNDVTLDGRAVWSWPHAIAPGQVLRVGSCLRGLRTYIAVAGGWDAPVVLGSRACDTLSGLGPPPLQAGDTLGILDPAAHARTEPAQPSPERRRGGDEAPLAVRILPGPRIDCVDADGTDAAMAVLCHPERSALEVSPRSDRTGVRLIGTVPRRPGPDPASEGMVPGAVQLPPDGHPLVLMANHAPTGGYPAVAVVVEEDLGLLAQARPGRRVRFEPA